MTITDAPPQLSDPSLDDEDAVHTHIVRGEPGGKGAEALVLEARVMGTPVEALCGFVWVPSRDPSRYPLCSKCEEILKQMKEGGG